MGKFTLFVVCAFILSFIIIALAAGTPFPGSGILMIKEGDPLLVVALWALGFALASFAMGMLTGDYSWVDRLWSTLPVCFAWYYAWRGKFSLELIVSAILVTAWGARLTVNFAQKGGYAGMEDYRWAILRGRIKNPIAWQAFNLFFISIFQVGIFVLFTMPLARIAEEGGSASTLNRILFYAACALMLGSVLIETIADREQWDFQEAKRLHKERKAIKDEFRADAERGFRTSGLFSVSRHPNYFGELMTWCSLFLMGAASRGASFADGILHWSAAGILALVALFIGSTIFTEGITASKYPGYVEYCKRVSPIVPWFAKK